MKALRNYLDKIKPNFEEGGKYHAFQSVFDGFETFLFVPNRTSKSGTHIHDAIDSKRIMSMVVIALIPALLFGMYNVGYQHFTNTGATGSFIEMFAYGFLAVLPKIIVSYIVGLGIEFVVAQWKKEEIQEGFLVSGILIPMIVPVDCPLWILAVATAFSVIFAKEVFGGTGMNVFNVALITRAFLFFAYPTKMSGDAVWVSGDSIFGMGQAVDGLTVATPLGEAATTGAVPPFSWDMVTGLIPGSIGETSVIAIALGAILLLATGIASWKTMFSVFVGGAFMAWVFNTVGPDTPMAQMPWYEHLVLANTSEGWLACFTRKDRSMTGSDERNTQNATSVGKAAFPAPSAMKSPHPNRRQRHVVLRRRNYSPHHSHPHPAVRDLNVIMVFWGMRHSHFLNNSEYIPSLWSINQA